MKAKKHISPDDKKGKGKVKRKYKVIFGIIIVLIIIRLFLPAIVLHYANKTLANMKGYYGHIEDIDIALYRGAYIIDSIYLNKVDSVTRKQTPFFKSRSIDLSVEWKALFDGSIVGELVFESPKLLFTKDKTEIADVKKDTTDFRKLLKDFMPLKINRFEINNGSIHYVDRTSSPKVDIALNQTHILAQNLTNSTDENVDLPSTVTASANSYEGTLDFNMKLNALAKDPTFDLNAEIKNTNLVLMNDFMKAYGNFDVNKGRFGLYTEMAAKDGKFKGYVKPVIKDLDVLGPEDRTDNIFHKLWESLVGGVGVVFRNQKEDQVATKVPIEGKFTDPEIDNMEAIWEVLRNAFIQALVPSIDHEIDLKAVEAASVKDDRNIFQRIFNTGKKDDKEKEDKEKK